MAAPITFFDLTAVTTWASTEFLHMYGDGYDRKITMDDWLVQAGVHAAANRGTIKLGTLDGLGKQTASERPTDTLNRLGKWDPETNTPAITDAGASDGDYYDIAFESGATSYARDLGVGGSITWTAGGRAARNATQFENVPKVANQADGSATEDEAAVLLDSYRKGDVNDRVLAPESYIPFSGASPSRLDVPDNAVVSFGDGSNDFAFAGRFLIRVPSVSVQVAIAGQWAGSNATWRFVLNGTGKLNLELRDKSAGVSANYTQTTASIVANEWTLVEFYYPGDGGASAQDNTILRVNGAVVAGSATNNASYVAMENSADAIQSGYHGFSGTYRKFDLGSWDIYNCDPEAGAVDAGVLIKNQWGGATATSGTLAGIGRRVRLKTFVAGDDFTNTGAASNATGEEWVVATTVTPTTWTNSSTIEDLGAVASLDIGNMDDTNDVVPDRTSNGINGTIYGTKSTGQPRAIHINAESPAADEKLLSVSVAGAEKVSIDQEGTIRQEGLAVDAPVAKYVADPISTPGTLTHQIAVDIDGTTYYIPAYSHGS